ncbi:MAG: metal ABC transporter solute-binding protein, Zn/Mn family [Tepidisphaerales bacterium]
MWRHGMWLVWLMGAAWLSLAAAGAGGCSRAEAEGERVAPPAGRPVRVVATVGMVADVVRAVMGERAEVVQLIGSAVDPHLYKASRADVAAIARADVVVHNGLHLEGKLSEVLRRASHRRLTVALAELVPPERRLEQQGQADPHVWMDPSLWAAAALALAEKLAAWDPADGATYRANAEAYAAELLALHAQGQAMMATIPPDKRVLVTSHDAFGYFGRAYGLEVRAVQGLSTESEAGLREINALVDFLVRRRVPAVFVESSVPRKSIEALIEGARRRGHEVVIGGELFSDAMGPEGTYEGTYVGMIDHNLTTVARALGGEVPERGLRGRLVGGVSSR